MKNCTLTLYVTNNVCIGKFKNVVHTCISTLPIIRFTTKQLIEAMWAPLFCDSII